MNVKINDLFNEVGNLTISMKKLFRGLFSFPRLSANDGLAENLDMKPGTNLKTQAELLCVKPVATWDK